MPRDPAQIDQSGIDRLSSMLGLRPDAVIPIPSGTSGQAYLVQQDERRLVAKFFSEDARVLLGPEAQFRLLEQIESSHVAPEPVAFDSDVLVTAFVENSRSLEAKDFRDPELIGLLGARLRDLHGVSIDLPPIDPMSIVDQYVSVIGGKSSLARRDRARHAELLELAADIFAPEGGKVLCHNDLLAENVLIGDGRLTFIDFDFAFQAPAVLDLASAAVMNELTSAAVEDLLQAYFSGGEIPFSLSGFARVQRLVRLVAHFWSLASANAGAAIVAQYRIRDD